MKVVGIRFTSNDAGQKQTTLEVLKDFSEYYNDTASGRGCSGQQADSIYVGTLDCSMIKLGCEIEVYYGKAVTTKNGGMYQPVKKIDVINK